MKTSINPNCSGISTARLFAAAIFLAIVCNTLANVRYVDVNSTNATPPYISWTTAATNIQDAVDAAVAGDEVVVTNGVCVTGGRGGNCVTMDKPLNVRSVNGPELTIIDGSKSGRCAYLTDGVSLSGFTLTNGSAVLGAGVFCESTNDVVANCVVSGNSTYGGCCSIARGGGAFGGTLNKCILSHNLAVSGGNGHGGTPCYGGGACNAILNNCTLSGNAANGEDIEGAEGFGGGAYGCTLNNCTLTGNRTTFPLGAGGGASGCILNNCIVYYNTAPNYDSSSSLNYSCTMPQPISGVGNITNAPLFVNTNGWANMRLQSISPCINAGENSYSVGSTDLDGNPRIVQGMVDMGAYEFQAIVHYVDGNSTNSIAPYTTWATAATNIQEAVDVALAGDGVVTANGTYATGGARNGFGDNRVAVDKPLSLGSLNGAQSAIIDGGHLIRCVYLTNGACLSGFTLTNSGRSVAQGGGVFCESTNAVVSNCVLSGNWASGGLFSNASGGAAYGGTLNNCILSWNTASGGGQGRGSAHGLGGGAVNATLNNCTLSSNFSPSGGGAAYCTLNNCMLTNNYALTGGGADSSTLNNCTLSDNWAEVDIDYGVGGYAGGAYGCILNNCTLSGNSAEVDPFSLIGGYAGGAYACSLKSCIVYFNTGAQEANYDSSSTLNYCCTTPQPTNGFGNITNAPLFLDQASGNLRLQSNSPCINAGLNALAPAGLDPDGNPRIAGGTVDIGAYEYQAPASLISYAWLQQYSLPTDGSVDSADPDGDGINNWQEWRCQTDPTNSLSVLRLMAPVTEASSVTVSWSSVGGLNYFLERATNLAASPAFTPLASNLPGQLGTSTYIDSNAKGAGPWFYRVGVTTP